MIRSTVRVNLLAAPRRSSLAERGRQRAGRSACNGLLGGARLEALLPDADLSILRLSRAEYWKQLAVVAGHLLAFAAATVWALWRQGGRKGNA